MKRFLAMRLVALVFSFTFIVCSGFFTYASAQSNVKVTGQVTDNAGLPVIGAGVVEDGTTSGVVTDASGNYEISVNTGENLSSLVSDMRQFVGSAFSSAFAPRHGHHVLICVVCHDYADWYSGACLSASW